MVPVTYHLRGYLGLNYYWAAAPYPSSPPQFIGYPGIGLLRSGIPLATADNAAAAPYVHQFWDIELAAPEGDFYPRLNSDGLRLFAGAYPGAGPQGKFEVLKKINGVIESQIVTYADFQHHNIAGPYLLGVEIFNFHRHPGPVKFKIRVLEDFVFNP